MNIYSKAKALLASVMGAGLRTAPMEAEPLMNLQGRAKGAKGQLRARRHKPSGAAAQKRAATKRRNKAKH
ncbi:hypothetical protein VPHK436_0019 [Vibrio phage K436]